MKQRDEEIAKALLWLSPGTRFWYRETAVGNVVEAIVTAIKTNPAISPTPWVQARLPGHPSWYTFSIEILQCHPMWERP